MRHFFKSNLFKRPGPGLDERPGHGHHTGHHHGHHHGPHRGHRHAQYPGGPPADAHSPEFETALAMGRHGARGGWGFAGGPGGEGRFGRGAEGGHGGGRGGRGGRRVFDHGELRLVVLALIAETPRHGYEIIKAIEERLAGSYSPSPGVIYPTLTLLQELGYATVEEQDGKKRYSITEAGQAYLADNRVAVEAAMKRMQAVSARLGDGPAPQIIRAMENLKLALRLRMDRGPLTPEQSQAVADALDAAAHRVDVA